MITQLSKEGSTLVSYILNFLIAIEISLDTNLYIFWIYQIIYTHKRARFSYNACLFIFIKKKKMHVYLFHVYIFLISLILIFYINYKIYKNSDHMLNNFA